MVPVVLARVAVLVLAAAVVAILAGRHAEHRACQDGRERAFLAGSGRDVAFAERAARDVIESCSDTAGLIAAAGPTARAGADGAARRLLETAVDREPDNARAWSALARLTARSDPARSREAAARAAQLNPRGRPPGARRAPTRPSPRLRAARPGRESAASG